MQRDEGDGVPVAGSGGAVAVGDEPREAAGSLGARPSLQNGWSFCLWAPRLRRAALEVQAAGGRVNIPLTPGEHGYFYGSLEGIEAGARYWLLDDQKRRLPDPTSRSQPEGVHGPSQLVDLSDFAWSDQGWRGRPLAEYVIYELHVGTFTRDGTLDAAIAELPRLVDLGITAVELMPVAEFPGRRNWGYDGVGLFAVHHAYGGPRALQRFVSACHRHGLAVILDVVYNHLGPEGNHLGRLGPYFTDAYHTPWGAAVNLDGPHNGSVRRFFRDNALMWLQDFHVDALRLDAVHAFIDRSPQPFLAELSDAVRALSERTAWQRFLIAESDANDPRLLASPEQFGLGMHGVWADDFHHAVHALLTGERRGYYADYGSPVWVQRSERDGFAYQGQYSEYRSRRHGGSPHGLSPERFVVCIQNHDQVGNRARGDRLSTLVDRQTLHLAAALLLTSTHTPLLFMGEEWGDTAPFAYFTDHGDPELVQAVRQGRRAEFAAHGWNEEPLDPQDPATFEASRLDPARARGPEHRATAELYARLLRLRHGSAFQRGRKRASHRLESGDSVMIARLGDPVEVVAAFNLGQESVPVELDLGPRPLHPVLDSGDPRVGGQGRLLPQSPHGGKLDLILPRAGWVVLARQNET